MKKSKNSSLPASSGGGVFIALILAVIGFVVFAASVSAGALPFLGF